MTLSARSPPTSPRVPLMAVLEPYCCKVRRPTEDEVASGRCGLSEVGAPGTPDWRFPARSYTERLQGCLHQLLERTAVRGWAHHRCLLELCASGACWVKRVCGLESSPGCRGGGFMSARSTDSASAAGSSGSSKGSDPRLRELIDHLVVDLAHLFVGVPQPGVHGPVAARPPFSKEV